MGSFQYPPFFQNLHSSVYIGGRLTRYRLKISVNQFQFYSFSYCSIILCFIYYLQRTDIVFHVYRRIIYLFFLFLLVLEPVLLRTLLVFMISSIYTYSLPPNFTGLPAISYSTFSSVSLSSSVFLLLKSYL